MPVARVSVSVSVPVPGGPSLPVARSRLGVALGAEGRPAAGIGVGPAGRGGHGAAGRGGEAGPRLVGARRCLGAGGAAVGSGLGGLRGVGLRGVAAPRVLRGLLRRQLLRLPREGGCRRRGRRLAVGRELLGLLRGGLLLRVACWKGKERGRAGCEREPRAAGACRKTVCGWFVCLQRQTRNNAVSTEKANRAGTASSPAFHASALPGFRCATVAAWQR